jgi:hypothetical protein
MSTRLLLKFRQIGAATVSLPIIRARRSVRCGTAKTPIPVHFPATYADKSADCADRRRIWFRSRKKPLCRDGSINSAGQFTAGDAAGGVTIEVEADGLTAIDGALVS